MQVAASGQGLVGQADGGSCVKNREQEWGGGTVRAGLCRGGQQGCGPRWFQIVMDQVIL